MKEISVMDEEFVLMEHAYVNHNLLEVRVMKQHQLLLQPLNLQQHQPLNLASMMENSAVETDNVLMELVFVLIQISYNQLANHHHLPHQNVKI
jgi:hypothetical protein